MVISSKPHSFRVPLTVPSAWKMNVIARYKLSSSSKKNSRQQSNLIGQERQKKPRREVDLHNLQELYERGQEIRQKIHEINSVRHSLLWMLKKATQYELQQNHQA